MASKKRHHFNPKHLLRGFTQCPDSDFIWRYEINGSGTPIKMNVLNAGVETDYYTYTTTKGIKDRDSIENSLSKIEQLAEPAINKIRLLNPIDYHDKMNLAIYLAVMLTRVPKHRARIRGLLPEFVDSNKPKIRKKVKQLVQAGKLPLDEILEVDKFLDEEFTAWKEKPPHYLFLPTFSQTIARSFYAMSWHYIVNESNKFFVTGDNPMVFTEAKGLKPPEGEFIFPVSSYVTLWGVWKPINSSTLIADHKLLEMINVWMIKGAVKYIYGCEDSSWVQKLLSK